MSELDTLIVELRHELAVELPIKLHAYAPAGGRHTRGGPAEPDAGDEPDDSDGRSSRRFYNPGMTGLPFSRAFDRYLNPEQHGGDFLAADSIIEVRDYCRREHFRENHSDPDRPYSWNLCARIVIAAVELRQPLTFIAERENIDAWLARNLLTAALKYAAEWRYLRKKGVIIGDESRAQLDEAEALPVVLAREHSVLHEQRVWELWRAKFPYLRSWESELTRRRAFHALHCHDRCGLLAGEAA